MKSKEWVGVIAVVAVAFAIAWVSANLDVLTNSGILQSPPSGNDITVTPRENQTYSFIMGGDRYDYRFGMNSVKIPYSIDLSINDPFAQESFMKRLSFAGNDTNNLSYAYFGFQKIIIKANLVKVHDTWAKKWFVNLTFKDATNDPNAPYTKIDGCNRIDEVIIDKTQELTDKGRIVVIEEMSPVYYGNYFIAPGDTNGTDAGIYKITTLSNSSTEFHLVLTDVFDTANTFEVTDSTGDGIASIYIMGKQYEVYYAFTSSTLPIERAVKFDFSQTIGHQIMDFSKCANAQENYVGVLKMLNECDLRFVDDSFFRNQTAHISCDQKCRESGQVCTEAYGYLFNGTDEDSEDFRVITTRVLCQAQASSSDVLGGYPFLELMCNCCGD